MVLQASGELRQLTKEAEAAKTNLVAFHDEIARLREEKVRMLARLANARARLRLQEVLSGLSPDADIRALEGVRDHINRLVTETQLSGELGDTELERRLGRIREVEAESAARVTGAGGAVSASIRAAGLIRSIEGSVRRS